jgi:hypothetical protein
VNFTDEKHDFLSDAEFTKPGACFEMGVCNVVHDVA